MSSDRNEVRLGEAGFVIHFLGLICGYRYQFFDWWFDGRVQVDRHFEFSSPDLQQLASSIDRALNTLSTWGQRQRMVAINAMYLFWRTAVHERESDRFDAEYKIVDAAFALGRDIGRIPPPSKGRKRWPHTEQIEAMCSALGLAFVVDITNDVVQLRNPLTHEAFWDRGMPGTPRGETSFRASYWLPRLAQRALLCVLGLEGDYLRSPWWEMGGFYFDLKGDAWP